MQNSVRKIQKNTVRYSYRLDGFSKKLLVTKCTFLIFIQKDECSIIQSEALEHHIHAYLNDLQALREKILYFVGSLKNDVKRDVSDKQAVDKQFGVLTKKIFQVFSQVAEYRNPHQHTAFKFIDGAVLDAQGAEMFLNNRELAAFLTDEVKRKLAMKRDVAINAGKMERSKMAANNTKEIGRFIDALVLSIIPSFYKVLDLNQDEVEEEFCYYE